MNAYQKRNLKGRKAFIKVIPGRFTRDDFKREIYKAKEIFFWGEGWICQTGEYVEPSFYDWHHIELNCLDDISYMFGCKSKSRALTIFNKCLAFFDRNAAFRFNFQLNKYGWMLENGEEHRARINLAEACCAGVAEMVKLADAREYARHLGLGEEYVNDEYYAKRHPEFDDSAKRKDICKEIVLQRHRLIKEQRCVRDRLSALKDLRKQLKKNNRTSEYSRRQIRALGFVA